MSTQVHDIYFWTDYIKTPRWVRRATQLKCHSCDVGLTKASKHCHLCGIIFCSSCLPKQQAYTLPQRFNVKQKPGQTAFTVCTPCLKQVTLRRLSCLSELSELENVPLSTYSDLCIVSSTPIATNEQPTATIGSLKYLQLNATSPSVPSSLNGTLLHGFLGVQNTMTLKQLYQFINFTIGPHNQYLQNIALKINDRVVKLDDLSRLTIKQLLPYAQLATDEDIEQYKIENGGAYPPTPATFTKLLRERDEALQRQKEAEQQARINAAAAAAARRSSEDALAAAIIEGGGVINNNNNNDSNNNNNNNMVNSPSNDNMDKRYPDAQWVVAIHTYIHKQDGDDDNDQDQAGDGQRKKEKHQFLSFAKHDRLQVINQQSPEWSYAISADGLRKGWIPRSYVMDEIQYNELKKKRAERRGTRTGSIAGGKGPTTQKYTSTEAVPEEE